jgi:hypothetical protein
VIAAGLDTMVIGSVKSITLDNGSGFDNLTEGCRVISPVYVVLILILIHLGKEA